MKIAIYSPYLDTVGGGEKYMLTIASIISSEASVDILLDTNLRKVNLEELKNKIRLLHEIDLSKCNFILAPLGKGSSMVERLSFLSKYDYLFYLTDGSLFFSSAKNNIIHFQVPFTNITTNTISTKIKLSSWKLAIYNSFFTKEIIEKNWRIKGEVVYPPIDIKKYKVLKKKKQIISVGRFFGFTKSKKHEVMIEAFKDLSKEIPGWSLVLAGGASDGDSDYIEELKRSAQGFQIDILPNISIQDLVKLYGESSIYWHAAGYGEKSPEKFEHFGITTVEGMASGCVPIVINLGGQTEIVNQGENGFLWNDLNELKDFTLKLSKNEKLLEKMSSKALNKAKEFDQSIFERKIRAIIHE